MTTDRNDLRPAGLADAPLIQDDLITHAQELLDEGDVTGAADLAAQAAELLAEVE